MIPVGVAAKPPSPVSRNWAGSRLPIRFIAKITSSAGILFSKPAKADTYIGKRCFIGVNAIIMCGVKVNDNVIVGSGSVVTKDIPANCIVAGNPARIIKEGIQTKKFGQLMQQS